MIEAFERHLSDIEISKKFEKAKTKEEKIAACKKYLEDNDYDVVKRIKTKEDLMARQPMNTLGGGLSNHGTLTIDANTFNNLVVTGGKNILGGNIINNTPKIEYLTAKSRVTERQILTARDPLEIESEVGKDLRNLIKKELDYMLQNKKCIIKDKDYSTGDVLYGIKIGVVL